jgi:K(+)-stimulated pyrophosphate-energized sodium pump
MSLSNLIPVLLGVVGLIAAYFIYRNIMKYSEGEEKIARIGQEIHLGAMVFMALEYKMLLMFT